MKICIKKVVGVLALAILLTLPVLADEPVVVYGNGTIITMNETSPQVEAVAVQSGTIVAIGSEAEITEKYPDADKVDLEGQTLLPGFIDGHSHFFQAAMIADYANVSAPPVGPAKDIAGVVDTLKKHVADHPPGAGDWVVGYGYDGPSYSDGREMTRDDLDKDFPDVPVALIHVSGHG